MKPRSPMYCTSMLSALLYFALSSLITTYRPATGEGSAKRASVDVPMSIKRRGTGWEGGAQSGAEVGADAKGADGEVGACDANGGS